jgi:endonuclease/exonuclease/phosphatase family metal-dependent hydrolase
MESFAEAVPPTRPDGHHFDPIVVNRPALAARPAFKIVAFNAQGGRHLRGIIACLRRPPLMGADVILLSEADWRLRRSNGAEVAASIAAELGMSLAFLPEFGIPREHGEPWSFLGNAILSSCPLSDICAVSLPNLFLRPRMRRLVGAPAGLVTKTVVNGKTILIGVAHLNSRWDPAGRDLQVREYLANFPAEGLAIVGGDFNTTTVDLRGRDSFRKAAWRFLAEPRRLREPERWESLFERLAEAGFKVRGANAPGKPTFTFTRAIPPFLRPKLDWIALRGLEPVPGSAAVVPARLSAFSWRVSDHDFVVCDVRI